MIEPLQNKEVEFQKRINDALDNQRKLMNEKQEIEIENIRKQCQNEIDVSSIRKLFSLLKFIVCRSFENLWKMQLSIKNNKNYWGKN